jgi:hypothetical protein
MLLFHRCDSNAAYNLETAKAALDACTHDLTSEDDRMTTIDGKLTQLAAFSGVSIAISGGVGGSVLAAGSRLSHGFLIGLGSCMGIAEVLLFAGIVVAFRALSPKRYHSVDLSAVRARTTPEWLKRDPSEAIALIAAGRRDLLVLARGINDAKGKATIWAYVCASAGFALLVVGLLVAAVGSVV